jgi:hypothetical protein
MITPRWADVGATVNAEGAKYRFFAEKYERSLGDLCSAD